MSIYNLLNIIYSHKSIPFWNETLKPNKKNSSIFTKEYPRISSVGASKLMITHSFLGVSL